MKIQVPKSRHIGNWPFADDNDNLQTSHLA